jgi:hypothetical protein
VTEHRISLAATPPSFNKVGHTGNRWTWTREKALWQDMIEKSLMAGRVPRGLGVVKARAELWFPTKRRRDTGNYRTLLEKCLGDALVNGGWLDDDTPDLFSFAGVEFLRGPARTDLILAVTPPRLTPCDEASHPTPPHDPDQGSTAPPRRFRRPPRG